MYLISSVMILLSGIWVLFLPGLRQDKAAWQRSIDLLRGAPAAPGLGMGRAATAADIEQLVVLVPELESLSAAERDILASHALVIEVPTGTAIVNEGDTTDKAYFVTAGRAIAGKRNAGRRLPCAEPIAAGRVLRRDCRPDRLRRERPMWWPTRTQSIMQVPGSHAATTDGQSTVQRIGAGDDVATA